MPVTGPSRPPARAAEAARNRERLLDAAAARYASGEPLVTLDSIARAAGVGIGTLYRHFPTREALVEAVYRDQMSRLASEADRLLASEPPSRAFRLWMDAFVAWAVTKHGMVDALRTVMAEGRLEFARMRSELADVCARFLRAGVERHELRADVEAADVAAALAGVLAVAGAPAQQEQAGRLLDLLLDGLRPAR